jgi:hypothetical protein
MSVRPVSVSMVIDLTVVRTAGSPARYWMLTARWETILRYR